MNLTAIDRNLIKMLFRRGSVSEISGTYMDGGHEGRWEIIHRVKNLFRDDDYYDIGLSGTYEWITAGTIEEAFEKLDKMLEEVAA